MMRLRVFFHGTLDRVVSRATPEPGQKMLRQRQLVLKRQTDAAKSFGVGLPSARDGAERSAGDGFFQRNQQGQPWNGKGC